MLHAIAGQQQILRIDKVGLLASSCMGRGSAVAAFMIASADALRQEEWKLADVAVVTRHGVKVGICGEVVFPTPISLEVPLLLTWCGAREVWTAGEGHTPALGGLRAELLDGEDRLYHVLPLDYEGSPLATTELGPCPETGTEHESESQRPCE